MLWAEKDWLTRGRRAPSPAGIRIRALDNAGKGAEPEFSMPDNLGESDVSLSTTQFSMRSPKCTLILADNNPDPAAAVGEFPLHSSYVIAEARVSSG